MHAPTALPLLRRLLRVLAYALFQLVLGLAYVLRSVGALRAPFRFGHAATDDAPARPRAGRRVHPRAPLSPRPAL
ncbi:hypothetical protein [Hymenobacter weizhouensis]|uniref:hypothetical protein n=1 Tax=Hymenobacter sp. YIM 151500-1 TaxID=2987689 RepID=UPI002225EF18|nr:hypothetical protein [Hymenobacter sp. YIM 151500-1]UYZ63891.1 hypothetical protein OIS53_03375 [Hymenobacter sp. YIM 151500-1]